MFQGLLMVAACTVGAGPDSGADLARVGKLKLEPPGRVGYIFIVGNEVTRQDIYLDRLNLSPGEKLTSAALRKSERGLAPLWLLGVRCTVTTLGRERDSEYQDVVVRVKESPIAWVLGTVHYAIKHQVDLLLGQ
jgi:hypothetical protein